MTDEIAFARLKAAGLLADDPDIVALFDGDPTATDFADKARASKPHFFHRNVRDLSPAAYAEAEAAVLRNVRMGFGAKQQAARLARIGVES